MPNNQIISTQLVFKSYQYTFTDLNGTTGTGVQTFTMDTLPQGSVILYVRVKHSVAFACSGTSTITPSVGKSAALTYFSTGLDVCQAVADTTLAETYATAMSKLSAMTLLLTFTPGTIGATLASATAGVVNIDILYAPALTPTFTSLYSSGAVL